MTVAVSIVASVLVLLWLLARFGLSGEDLTRWDAPDHPSEGSRPEASPEHARVVEMVQEMGPEPTGRISQKDRVRRLRDALDSAFVGMTVDAEVRDVDAGGVRAEWVVAPGADPSRRILYIHGGGFIAGSPKSHRGLTARLSAASGAAVLSIDYRLTPEHTRADCVEDCCQAYRWILENGPNGPGAPSTLFVAGDSAGGNLTLVTLAWARDEGLRAADGAVAFSPVVDGTYSGPNAEKNLATDPMLSPALGPVLRMPRTVMLLLLAVMTRRRPQDPLISPIFGDLGDLPPLLVQASEAEVLFDDARRYVNKARAAGSPATLQTWPGMVHVFQAFGPDLPEANEALERVATFLASCESEGASAAAG